MAAEPDRPESERASTPSPSSGAPGRTPWRVEGARKSAGRSAASPNRSLWPIVFVVLALEGIIWLAASSGGPARVAIPYSVFDRQVQSANIATVNATGASIQGTFRHAVRYPATATKVATQFSTQRPTFADDHLLQQLLRDGVVVTARPTGGNGWISLLLTLGPVLLIGAFIIYMMRRAGGLGGRGSLGGFGSSRARRYEANEQRTTFADVAGIDEATDELAEVVDFLRHPDRYWRLGGKIPRGVLLTGLPGTGKTLLARAVAGEADVPFFSVSASEFVEMLVGVGASRVRDLFEHAKQESPAIVFIDELDAIGRRRGGGALTGANDEREQTLNQILTEMDGFTGNEGVIVLAATNRPEILDPALLRAGRFDRRIAVNPPDLEGRLRILKVHARDVPLEPDLDLAVIAADTPGMVGADLRNLVNEAALGAARRGAEAVAEPDFTVALERIVLGAARHIVISESERRRTAYHESGHALLGMLQAGADPVRKISIIPRGEALGVTFQSPDADRYGLGERYLRGRLVGLLGGRAAEQLIFGETTTGAESDLEQATMLARQMIGRWGMSSQIGLVSALPARGDELAAMNAAGTASQRTLQLIDDDVKRMTDHCYAQAVKTLSEHREQLDALAGALLAAETLDEAGAYAAAGLPVPEPAPALPAPRPAGTPTADPEPGPSDPDRPAIPAAR
jgi:cell division protease FtsH